MAGISSILRGSKSVQKTLKDLRSMFTTEIDEVNAIIGIEGVRGVQRNIREQHGPNGEPWAGAPVLRPNGRRLRDTSRLYNSYTYSAPLGSKTVRIGTNVLYAPLQHYGGTITPKKAKMLAIPANPRVRRAYTGNFRRDFPEAFVITSKRGNKLLVRKKDSTRKGKSALEILAYLKESVTVPASPHLGIGRDTWKTIIDRIEKRVAKVAKQGESGGGDPLAFFGGTR